MNTIKIGFSKPKKWKPFAWLIMAGYGISYDHVFIELYSTKYDRKMIYQASGSKVNFMGYDLFHEGNVVVVEYEVSLQDENYKKMMQFAIDNSGRPYGIKQAFGMAIVRLAEVLGRTIRNPFKDEGKTFVCSEMGAYILENYAHVIISKEIDDITPKDLWSYFQSIPNGAQAAQLPIQPSS